MHENLSLAELTKIKFSQLNSLFMAIRILINFKFNNILNELYSL